MSVGNIFPTLCVSPERSEKGVRAQIRSDSFKSVRLFQIRSDPDSLNLHRSVQMHSDATHTGGICFPSVCVAFERWKHFSNAVRSAWALRQGGPRPDSIGFVQIRSDLIRFAQTQNRSICTDPLRYIQMLRTPAEKIFIGVRSV